MKKLGAEKLVFSKKLLGEKSLFFLGGGNNFMAYNERGRIKLRHISA